MTQIERHRGVYIFGTSITLHVHGVVSGRSMTGSKGDELGVSRGSDALRKPIYGHGKECVNTGEEVRPETEKGNTRWAREDASSRWASGGCEVGRRTRSAREDVRSMWEEARGN
ncbi:hypothetical protein DFH07DRAFT_764430 [Mycena maculata]|uniref:Uncharacterized protein n=1 Tax=Mycena maculata TaxID=230809 RepID=A0AAD7KB78_9AGAR|nr:hypothetical protein DFH07DRAFT_764430 [Mycena maculata]